MIAALLNLNCIYLLYFSFMKDGDDVDLTHDDDGYDCSRNKNKSSMNQAGTEESAGRQAKTKGNEVPKTQQQQIATKIGLKRSERESGFVSVATTEASGAGGDDDATTPSLTTARP